MYPPKQRRLLYGGLLGTVIIFGGGLILSLNWPETKPAESPSATSTNLLTAPNFDKTIYSNDTPASPWLVVNKRRSLNPVEYIPQIITPDVALRLPSANPEMQLSRQIAPAVRQLFAAAQDSGYEMIVASGYRSYSQQVVVYNTEVANNGQANADRSSARPGHSEHQTGLAVDVGTASRQCEIQVCFGDLPEGKWVAANAYKYGFIIRYMPGTEAVTGYTYEPWHLRYVGIELAAELYKQGYPPLETFFGLGVAPDYR